MSCTGTAAEEGARQQEPETEQQHDGGERAIILLAYLGYECCRKLERAFEQDHQWALGEEVETRSNQLDTRRTREDGVIQRR